MSTLDLQWTILRFLGLILRNEVKDKEKKEATPPSSTKRGRSAIRPPPLAGSDSIESTKQANETSGISISNSFTNRR